MENKSDKSNTINTDKYKTAEGTNTKMIPGIFFNKKGKGKRLAGK